MQVKIICPFINGKNKTDLYSQWLSYEEHFKEDMIVLGLYVELDLHNIFGYLRISYDMIHCK